MTATIRKWCCGAALALFTTVVLPATALAGTITLNNDTTKYSNGVGGEFKVTGFSGLDLPALGAGVKVGDGVFQTFCLEKNEFFIPGVSYQWTLNDGATAGGVSGGVLGKDPLDARTAYLYTQFWNGVLDDYDYTLGSGRVASAGQLQKAIWFLEGEISSLAVGSQAQTWVNEATAAVTSGSWVGIGYVRVMNITDSFGVKKQDQLVMITPLPGAAVMGIGMLGALGLARIRRNRRARR